MIVGLCLPVLAHSWHNGGLVVGYRTRWTCSRKAANDVCAAGNSAAYSPLLGLPLIFVVSRSYATNKRRAFARANGVTCTAAATGEHPPLPSLIEAGL
jgi:hypothetical protein